jgi:hypothetical protein
MVFPTNVGVFLFEAMICQGVLGFPHASEGGSMSVRAYYPLSLELATAYAMCDDIAWGNPLDYLFIDEAS